MNGINRAIIARPNFWTNGPKKWHNRKGQMNRAASLNFCRSLRPILPVLSLGAMEVEGRSLQTHRPRHIAGSG